VINEVLLPMLDEYGDQLQVVGIDTYQAAGSQLYQAAIEQYQISPERRGVPALVIHDVVLVGSQEIPDRFPALVKEGLAAQASPDWITCLSNRNLNLSPSLRLGLSLNLRLSLNLNLHPLPGPRRPLVPSPPQPLSRGRPQH
jgi:hypothetical protein